MRYLLILFLWAAPCWAQTTIGFDFPYRAQEGETFFDIGKKFHLALDHIAMANHLPIQVEVPEKHRDLIIPMRRIIPAEHPETGLLVNLPERMVYVFKNNTVINFYPIAIGRPSFPTPAGKYKIVERIKNPTWFPPAWAKTKKKEVPPGPDNPLGDRWIGLSAPGIGLHSTTDPLSVGDFASHGCMRMIPEFARELFDTVEVGWPCWITYETVKKGWDPVLGEVVQGFPDVYKMKPLLGISADGRVKRSLEHLAEDP